MARGDFAAAQSWVESAKRVPLLTPAEELHLGGLVQAWQRHPDGPDGAPEAVKRRGLRARNRMVSANLRLVASFVQARSHDGPLVDRFQNGTLGLIRAAERFDPERGYRFSTLAYWWLRAEVGKGEFAEASIKLPSNVFAAVRGQHNGACSPVNLAAGRAAAFVRSLDSVVFENDSDTTLCELLSAPAPVEQDSDLDELHERLAALDPIEQRLIACRWGMEGPPQTYAQLAAQEAISAGEAKKMLEKAMRKLKQEPEPDPPPLPPALEPWRPVEYCQLSLRLPSPNTSPSEP